VIKSDVEDLVRRLTPTSIGALETAAMLAIDGQHHEVRAEHLLLGLLAARSSDVATLVALHGIDPLAVRAVLQQRCASLRAGNRSRPIFARALMRLLDDAYWNVTVAAGARRIRSAAILATLLGDPERYEVSLLVRQLRKLRHGKRLAVLPLGDLTKEAREARAEEARS
jgi:type VI secretion system protein VasG